MTNLLTSLQINGHRTTTIIRRFQKKNQEPGQTIYFSFYLRSRSLWNVTRDLGLFVFKNLLDLVGFCIKSSCCDLNRRGCRDCLFMSFP
ncbi:hypothetical protein HanRHA438_Chr07g0292781 [Helianthus annuus]|uniref:Uncharacterized protein n=1 Tax=Helianthus annuus TaxID=4232 RepID=A0A9K3IIX2_HELAN|nr:hypothetical protein HanXRQr2_Chr07g0282181 [Helianthus annuus]KAJ0549297.1 hypothetical protein HanHA300_Chr07g0231961 [Helianthus annuus]KAJ0562251.1 hypothetical protein HanHA89_Chr07g0249121 [Helianthus annuus]KAJ0616965.1 hypothetical protein HanIR_Chr02g0096311 [Helianthus annuus]KAJ0727627.1 hypothetical protein HanLR1_Chr07g0231931 [Helianthus annuus]